MQGHVCNHPNGKSHICDCILEGSSHSSLQNGCQKYTNFARDDSVTSVFVGETHNFEPEVDGPCRVCGKSLVHRRHPHVFTQGLTSLCICGSGRRALIHQMTQI